MTTNVYWSYLGDSWIRATEPEDYARGFYNRRRELSTNGELNNMLACPAMQNYSKNVYGIRSMFDYDLIINDDLTVTSTSHTQKFFDDHVIVRDSSMGLLSLTQPYIFFTDKDSLEMTWQLPPFLEEPKNYHHIPGKFDIGKWFRSVDFSFMMRDGEKNFSIKRDEFYTYAEFHTSDKINFIKFEPTDKIKFYSQACFKNNYGVKSRPRKLSNFYDTFNIKNKILKEIKSSIIK